MDREREKRGIGKGQETESKNLVAGGFDQSLTGQAPHGPVVHRARALRAVEILRAGVPVEHRPFHSGPSAFGGDQRELLEHCLADSAAPILLEYEKIFQVESRTAAPSRIGTKKKREAERLAFVLRNQTFEGRVAIFHLCAQPGGSCLNRFGLTFELRECADEAKDRLGIARSREADCEGHQASPESMSDSKTLISTAHDLSCSAGFPRSIPPVVSQPEFSA